MSIKVETREVTPAMAYLWLQKNKRNRAINYKRVNLYAEEMIKGNWLEHHQGIAFYEDGTLADGQHRLAAVQQSGVNVKMLIAWNVPEKSGLMIDGHQQRQTHQAIRISGLADWIGKDQVAVAKLMIQIQTKKTASVSLSHNDLIKFCEKHRNAIGFSINGLATHKKYFTNSVVKASVACAFYYENPDRLNEFCKVIYSGVPKSNEDISAILFREWLIESGIRHNGSLERLNSVKRAMRAIKAFCDRQPIGKLYQPSDFIYLPV